MIRVLCLARKITHYYQLSKYKLMKTITLYLAVLLLASCGQSEKKESSPSAEVKTVTHELLLSYLELKDAFVTSDLNKISEPEGKFLGITMNYTVSDAFTQAVQDLSAAKDVESKRAAFSVISNEMYTFAKASGFGEGVLYYQYCPMAFNDTGAYWLSSEKKIANPYFGDKMLRCGSTKETL